jgi:hypothetical protein
MNVKAGLRKDTEASRAADPANDVAVDRLAGDVEAAAARAIMHRAPASRRMCWSIR